ncbi:MAG: hypothetical protein RL385_3967 [Pseudomonadota bacterium]|jgi:predicted DNA-binding protein (MmcQ/YjbR family)
MKTDDSKAVRAIVSELRKLCAKLPAAEEYVMVHHPAFRVGKKPFVIAGMLHGSETASLSVNLGTEMQHQLLGDPRFQKTPYIGQHGWVTIAREMLTPGELPMLVTESWRRIANKKQRVEWQDRRESKPATKVDKVERKAATTSKTGRAAGVSSPRSS